MEEQIKKTVRIDVPREVIEKFRAEFEAQVKDKPKSSYEDLMALCPDDWGDDEPSADEMLEESKHLWN